MTTTPTPPASTISTPTVSTQIISAQTDSTQMIIERMIGTVNEDVHGPCVAIRVHDLVDVLSIIERVSLYCQNNPKAAAGLAHLWASDIDPHEIYTWTNALAAGLRRLVPVTP